MDDERREMRNAAIFARNGVIEQVGLTTDLPDTADEVLDLHGRHMVMPGLVNTHHHFYQTLTRVIPSAQNHELFDWLSALYPLWANMTSEHIYISTQIAAAELMLFGCTTASDHLYIYPNDCTLNDEIRGIQEIGLRFHASRGSMSVGESKGGLPPDRVTQDEGAILKDSQRLIEQYHDNSPLSMLRITLAPCSPFTVSQDLMRESAKLARSYVGVRLHTHLAETKPDLAYSMEKFGLPPGDYAEEVGWLGDDVWHAHCVHLTDNAIDKFARTGTGVTHCPCSNMRVASGFMPIRKMLDAGVKVGLGTDGAAANDASNLLNEARMATLLARVRLDDPAALTAREALEIATLGGAKVLGRNDIGTIAPGKAADFITFDIDRLTFAGAHHDVVAAIVFCTSDRVDYSYINGKRVIDRGQLTTVELPPIIEKHNKLAKQLIDGN